MNSLVMLMVAVGYWEQETVSPEYAGE